MKKKIIYFINIILVVSIIFQPLFIKAESTPNKGDLRCPVESNSDNCLEIKDANGSVIEVDIISGSLTNDGDIRIVKKVKKTSVLGRYEISFEIQGKNIPTRNVYADTNIILMLDMSKTVKDSVAEIRTATNNFYQKVKELENVNLAIIQFATNSYIRKNYSATSFSLLNYKEGNLGQKSHVEKALKQANDLLNDEKGKYIILLGDGQYWDGDDTDTDDAINWFKKMRDGGTKFYMIQYEGGTTDYSEKEKCAKGSSAKYITPFDTGCPSGYHRKSPIQYNYPYIKAYIKPIKWWCNYGNYDYSIRNWCANNNKIGEKIDYTTIFNDVINNIIIDIGQPGVSAGGTLIDNIGGQFDIVGSTEISKKIIVDKISETITTTIPFNIDIKSDAKTGWHQTNSNFNLTYVDVNNNEKKISCDLNPEVYWIETNQVIESCSGVALVDEITTLTNIDNNYYEKVCQEGYLQDKFYVHGFQVNAMVNNLNPGTKSFDLKGGLGFPTTINLSTNLYCSYRFKYQEFMNNYSQIQLELRKTNDSKEIAVLNKRLDRLKSLLNDYKNVLRDDLDNYITRFTNQQAMLRIKYSADIPDGVSDFINIDLIINNKNCNQTNVKTVLGTIIYDQDCTLSMSKNMQLPAVCLNMSDGEQTACGDTSKQLSGGNKFYTSLSAKSGDITLDIPNAGYSRDLHFKLKDCSYTSDDIKPLYRQIENDDPFLQTYTTPKREIPKNYSNNNYNFINIIKSDIWENSKFTYRFSLSKLDVYNINQDTNNLGSSKYLGNDCYINNNRKYVCELLHDTSQSGNYFTNIEVNNNKIS